MKKWPAVIHHASALARRDGGWLCHYCGAALCPNGTDAPTGDTVLVGRYRYNQFYQFALVDHVVPKTDGGSHDISNLVLACMVCNTRKGNLDYGTFVAIMADWLQAHKRSIPNMPIFQEP